MRCADLLLAQGHSVLVLEADNEPGGRLRTDRFNGYLLDRGFQVLQTAYPEARQVLDYEALELCSFAPGALIRLDGRFTRIGDPFRRLQDLPAAALSPVGSLADKLRVLALRYKLSRASIESVYAAREMSGIDWLRGRGFSDRFIAGFLRPFLAGVFFDPRLEVSSRAVEFVLWAFAGGDTALPAGGMGQISAQLANRLPAGAVRLGARVAEIREGRATLASGEVVKGRKIVLATEMAETCRLLGEGSGPPGRGTVCVYFAAPEAPIDDPILALNGTGRGLVNSLTVPSRLSARYAPEGMHLIGVNLLGAENCSDADLLPALRRELGEWFGAQVGQWRHLRTYRIPRALPSQEPPVSYPMSRTPKIADRLYVCGEYATSPSFQWALAAAAKVARAIGRGA